MLPRFCDQTVTVLRAPLAARRGAAVRDWSSATEHDVGGCSLQEGATSTDFDGPQRNASASQATLLMPAGADVRDGDRVRCDGRTWEVDGAPFDVRSPTGRASHRRASLREWRG